MKRENYDIAPTADSTGFKIRIITPALAKAHADTKDIPLLQGGIAIPGSTTLWDLRSSIANSLGSVVIDDLPGLTPECNCAFAKHIQRQGAWMKLECLGHSDSLTPCIFPPINSLNPLSSSCAICSSPISTKNHAVSSDSEHLDCVGEIFVRTDTGCGHVLHRKCIKEGKAWICPISCQACKYHITCPRGTRSTLLISYQ